MARYAHPDVLENGLSAVKNAATRLLLVNSFAVSDTYTTVVANAICTVVISTADITITSSGNNKVMTIAAKQGTASAPTSGTPDLHVIVTDGSSKILLAFDETSNGAVQTGATVNFPQLTYTSNQPT